MFKGKLNLYNERKLGFITCQWSYDPILEIAYDAILEIAIANLDIIVIGNSFKHKKSK